MNQDLAQVAEKKGLTIAAESDELHQKTARYLSQSSGTFEAAHCRTCGSRLILALSSNFESTLA